MYSRVQQLLATDGDHKNGIIDLTDKGIGVK